MDIEADSIKRAAFDSRAGANDKDGELEDRGDMNGESGKYNDIVEGGGGSVEDASGEDSEESDDGAKRAAIYHMRRR